jgi:hypothetical protein
MNGAVLMGVPVIGIPFYLANPELSKLEGQLTGI